MIQKCRCVLQEITDHILENTLLVIGMAFCNRWNDVSNIHWAGLSGIWGNTDFLSTASFDKSCFENDPFLSSHGYTVGTDTLKRLDQFILFPRSEWLWAATGWHTVETATNCCVKGMKAVCFLIGTDQLSGVAIFIFSSSSFCGSSIRSSLIAAVCKFHAKSHGDNEGVWFMDGVEIYIRVYA